MQSHLKDLLKNSHVKQEDIINKIFNKFSEVKKHIKTVLKDIDTECTAKKKLMSLQQRELMKSYAADFQKIVSYVN